jgi:hypothetical protein
VEVNVGCLVAGIALFLTGMLFFWSKGWFFKAVGWLLAVAGTGLMCATTGVSVTLRREVVEGLCVACIIIDLLLIYVGVLHFALSKAFLKGKDSITDLDAESGK